MANERVQLNNWTSSERDDSRKQALRNKRKHDELTKNKKFKPYPHPSGIRNTWILKEVTDHEN